MGDELWQSSRKGLKIKEIAHDNSMPAVTHPENEGDYL